ncbi:MAG: 50S ribosomal protein L4 [Bacteroides sp.]|jgi:large subunit ribosomal protein L4|nr:50S ribosomal protein L4 [Bacteroides sp.]
MELTVYNIDGSKTARTVVLNDGIFGIEPNDHAIYLDVKQYLANQRQGTHKSKERNEIAGSTRKLHRQKGTGGSRKGDIKSPMFRGGGRVFGPVPRDYSFKVNKKVKKLARRSALTYKAIDSNIMVLEAFQMEEPKTKKYLEILKKFNLENKKSLLVVPEVDRNLVLSSRNIPKAKVALASDLNTYMILNADHLLLVESSLPEVENILLD